MKSEGFTLTETVFAITVVILTSSYIVSAVNTNPVFINSLAKRVQSDIRYAQQLAMTTGVNHGTLFTAGGNYEVYRGNPSIPVLDPVTREALIVDVSEYGNISIVADQGIEFGPGGSPIAADNKQVQLIASNGTTMNICVMKNTGAVVVNPSNCISQ